MGFLLMRKKNCLILFSDDLHNFFPAFIFAGPTVFKTGGVGSEIPWRLKEPVMTLHQLRIFAAIAKHLSITKASEELHMGQSSASEQMKLLEAECGVALYRKGRCGIELTEDGHFFLDEAEAILQEVKKLEGRFKNGARGKEIASLRVGASHTPSTTFLPPLLAVFKETHPQVHVTLRTDKSRVLEQLILNSEIEIAVTTTPSHFPSLTYEPYRQMKMVVFAAARHPLAQRQQLTLADLARASLVIMRQKEAARSGTEEFIEEMERRELKPKILMRCDSSLAVKHAVKSGAGVGLLYKDTLEPELRNGELRIIKVPELKIHLHNYIAFRKEEPLSPNAQDWLILLREWPKKKKEA